jgi:hypothetical protein
VANDVGWRCPQCDAVYYHKSLYQQLRQTDAPMIGTVSRASCPKCKGAAWSGPQYVTRKPYSGFPEEMAERNLREALRYQCVRCGFCDFTPTADRENK